jgi:hypothetical protein
MFDAYIILRSGGPCSKPQEAPKRSSGDVSDMVGYCLLTSLQAQNAWKLQSECSIFYRL